MDRGRRISDQLSSSAGSIEFVQVPHTGAAISSATTLDVIIVYNNNTKIGRAHV
jgi:hypothetical protein